MNRLLSLALALACLTVAAHAADSPEFRGPGRKGIFPEQGLLKAWPEGGPKEAWVAEDIGAGYASASVVGGTIYVAGMLEDKQGYVFLLDLDGKVKGKIPYGKETEDKQAPGSRSTPTIDGDRLYIMSGPGVVHGFEIPSGKPLWQVDTMAVFGGKLPPWKFAESLLVDGDRLICTPGGPDASVVALDKMTGETVWTSKGLSDPASYCAPDIIEHNGHRILLTMTALYVVALSPETGAVLWTHEHKTDHNIHAVTPGYAGGIVFYTGGYGSGSGALELSEHGSSVTPLWTNEDFDCQHHGVVLIDGYLYGTGHQGDAVLRCLDLKTGKVMWRGEEIRQGVVVAADGMLYVYEGPKRGIVSLVKVSPDGFERTGSFSVPKAKDKHWAHPTISGKRLYIRFGGALRAYDIAAD